ncbi:hypothetical protein HMPREF1020_00545 [Clostridium sp. 7_3_54FAA]|nr:hypothetical protein HMPREF1020_00545 [Clostridium sp. 7_3_54FAA]
MAFIPGPALLDFLSHLLHTTFITDGRQLQMNQRYVDELRQKYIKKSSRRNDTQTGQKYDRF